MVSLLSYHPFLRGRHDELIVLFCPQADILGEDLRSEVSRKKHTCNLHGMLLTGSLLADPDVEWQGRLSDKNRCWTLRV